MGVLILLQGEIKSQGPVVLVLVLQVGGSYQIQDPQEGQIRCRYSCQ